MAQLFRYRLRDHVWESPPERANVLYWPVEAREIAKNSTDLFVYLQVTGKRIRVGETDLVQLRRPCKQTRNFHSLPYFISFLEFLPLFIDPRCGLLEIGCW